MAWISTHQTSAAAVAALEIGVEAVYYKDESERFEVSSFKALGGAYAVQVLLREIIGRERGREVTLEDIARSKVNTPVPRRWCFFRYHRQCPICLSCLQVFICE